MHVVWCHVGLVHHSLAIRCRNLLQIVRIRSLVVVVVLTVVVIVVGRNENVGLTGHGRGGVWCGLVLVNDVGGR